jgi:hypothetical protein
MLEDQDSGALDLQNQVLVAQQPSVSLNSLDPAWKEPGGVKHDKLHFL